VKLVRRLRRMAEADLDAVLAIDAVTPPPFWGREAFLHELELPTSRPGVLVDPAGRVIGFLVWWQILDEAHLQNVALSEAARRRGHGRWLVRAMLAGSARAGARRAFLEVRPDNGPARALYAALGFREVGRRRRYYADGADALLLSRPVRRRGRWRWASRAGRLRAAADPTIR
jgi:ribosomal-protein-alanine N-acetyltransferase